MVCSLFNTKVLNEPVLIYWKFGSVEQISTLIKEIPLENVICKKWAILFMLEWVKSHIGLRLLLSALTHWGRVMHICVSKLTIIGSDNGLLPDHYLKLYWNNVYWTLRNNFQWNFNQNLNISIQENAFEHVIRKMAAMLSHPQCVK